MIKSFILFIFVYLSSNATNLQDQQLLDNFNLKSSEKTKISTSTIAILTCSDFKLLTEDAFVVRNFGNIVDENVIASIEFALSNLDITFVIVIGHQDCFAVQGALDVTFKGVRAKPESLNNIFKYIQPSLGNIDDLDNLKKAVIDNSLYQKNQLIFKSQLIQNLIRKNKIRCLSLYYDVKTGTLSVIKD